MEFGRRTLLTGLGGLVLAGGMTSVVGNSLAAGQTQPGGRFEQVGGDHGWKPHKLDPKECAEVALATGTKTTAVVMARFMPSLA